MESPRDPVRASPTWLRDGRANQDVAGDWFTLLDLSGTEDITAIEAAFRSSGIPLSVLALDERHMREVYGTTLLLLRPAQGWARLPSAAETT